jgi:hypothetical protein
MHLHSIKPPRDPLYRWDVFRRVGQSRTRGRWQTMEYSRSVMRPLVPKPVSTAPQKKERRGPVLFTFGWDSHLRDAMTPQQRNMWRILYG